MVWMGFGWFIWKWCWRQWLRPGRQTSGILSVKFLYFCRLKLCSSATYLCIHWVEAMVQTDLGLLINIWIYTIINSVFDLNTLIKVVVTVFDSINCCAFGQISRHSNSSCPYKMRAVTLRISMCLLWIHSNLWICLPIGTWHCMLFESLLEHSLIQRCSNRQNLNLLLFDCGE
jgi:hypothetical protein